MKRRGHDETRELIRAALLRSPDASNNRIAQEVGCSDHTVKRVRIKLIGEGLLEPIPTLLGKDSKAYPISLPPKQKKAFLQGAPSNKRSDIETPAGVSQFLHDTISPVLDVRTILDPCSGRGSLTAPWAADVVKFEIADGLDFFAHRKSIDCDLVLMNPPFQGGQPRKFLAYVLRLVGDEVPIAMIAPMNFLLGGVKRQEYGGKLTRYAWLRDRCPPITSIVPLPQDVFVDAEVHSMILLFNLPQLDATYLIPSEYLSR